MPSPQFSPTAVHDLATSLFEKVGVRPADADLIARSLIEADRAGIHSHGLLRLPLYLRVVEQGGIDPTSEPRVVHRNGTVTVLDAAAAFGQVAMARAVEIATESARSQGIAAVAVQGSSHYGAGRFWTDQLAERGIAAILTSTTGPVATPFGGSTPLLGTNPVTLSLPSQEDSALVADLATTAGAYGKIVAAAQAGTDIPDGWGVDSAAQPTTDPAAVLDGGALLPFGGHKGSGISVMLEALSAALSGASYAKDTVDIWQDPSSRMNTGHLLIALDLAAFGEAGQILAKVSELQQAVRDAGPAGTVHAPGDLEHQRRIHRADSLEIPAATVQQLRELAEQYGLAFPSPLPEPDPDIPTPPHDPPHDSPHERSPR
jgi:L-2-hydroxycarboxylate dehydrogenase (NAD+)